MGTKEDSKAFNSCWTKISKFGQSDIVTGTHITIPYRFRLASPAL